MPIDEESESKVRDEIRGSPSMKDINAAIETEAGILFIAKNIKVKIAAIGLIIVLLSFDITNEDFERLPVISGIVAGIVLATGWVMRRKRHQAVGKNEENAGKFPKEFSIALEHQKQALLKGATEERDRTLIETIFSEMREDYVDC